MNHPGTSGSNFLSMRSVKQSGELKNSQIVASLANLHHKDQSLSLYFNLIKKKKPADTKKQATRVKQIVLRSPSNQQRSSDLLAQDPLAKPGRENDSRQANVSKFNASKVLFHDDKKTSRCSPQSRPEDPAAADLLLSQPIFAPRDSKKGALEFSRNKFYFNSEGSTMEKRVSESEKPRAAQQQQQQQPQAQQMLMNFDQVFSSAKQPRGAVSVSPKSQHVKSGSSPFRSPESQSQSTRPKSNLRDSRIDLLFDLENYQGPRALVRKGLLINEFCVDHPDKKSKFYITNGIFAKDLGEAKLCRGFCSKCSVQIAMKGFSLEEVLKDEEQDRKAKIDLFLQGLAQTEQKDSGRIDNLRAVAEAADAHFERQAERAESLFEELRELLSEKREQVLQELKRDQGVTSEELAELRRLLEVKQETVQAMKSDIESNLEKIITKIDSEPFNQIMANYELTISNLEQQVLEAAKLEAVFIKKNEAGFVRFRQALQEAVQLRTQTVTEAKSQFEANVWLLDDGQSFQGSVQTVSSRSAGESASQLLPSRITLHKEESKLMKAHPFNYQLYRQSPLLEGAKAHPQPEEDKKKRRRAKGKSAAALSFDNRMIVSKHQKADEIENERQQWKVMRENRQFMSMNSNMNDGDDEASIFTMNTHEQDTTSKYINILDKINDNQMKKNKFYSDIIKDIDADTHINHILKIHQPQDFDIIYECSKEYTVNQTPDLRDKEMKMLHMHTEDTADDAPQLNMYRLKCQKDLFSSK